MTAALDPLARFTYVERDEERCDVNRPIPGALGGAHNPARRRRSGPRPRGPLGERRSRVWLVDARSNNYLFRGPLPLDDVVEDGTVDFPMLIDVMNERLRDQHAPIETLPAEFAFVDVALLSNRAVGGSRGDEGFALRRIYSAILGAEQPWPDADDEHPTSLFTGPLDNVPAAGAPMVVHACGATYTLHPSVVWLPVSGNPTGRPPASCADGPDGYKNILASSFPIVALACSATRRTPGLSGRLSNLSVLTRVLHEWMARDRTAEMPHVYYIHCTNGHDRVGMATTGYVLAAYGAAFGFDLEVAYHHGMVGAFLPEELPPDVSPDANFWHIKERRDPGTGGLKKEYLELLQALGCLYRPADRIPPAPSLAVWLPERPLWEAGYAFADPAGTPTVETPAHYVRVRPARSAP